MTLHEVLDMKVFQRISALLLAALLLLAPARAESGRFSDVPEAHWAYESVYAAEEKGLVNGLSPKTFGLGQNVTRAQYCAMLCRLLGWETVSPEKPTFSDNQDQSAWYYGAVETAYANGALLKLGAECAPNEPLLREEMAAMTVRALGCAPLAGVVQDDCPFSDVTTNRGYVALAYHMGFMGGVSAQMFSPRTASTREQAAAVLLRVYDRLHAELVRRPLSEMPAMGVVIAEPLYDTESRMPMCPRAPMESVYDAAVKAGAGGAVTLLTAPWSVTVKDGKAHPGTTLTQAELAALLADDTARTYRSARYGSSYLLRAEGGGQTAVWYETAEDIAQKLELCKLLGVGTVYVE